MNNMVRLVLLTLLSMSYSYPGALARTVSVARGGSLYIRFRPGMGMIPNASYNMLQKSFWHSHTPPTNNRDVIERKIAHAEIEANNALARLMMYRVCAVSNGSSLESARQAVKEHQAVSEHQEWMAKAASLRRDLKTTINAMYYE